MATRAQSLRVEIGGEDFSPAEVMRSSTMMANALDRDAGGALAQDLAGALRLTAALALMVERLAEERRGQLDGVAERVRELFGPSTAKPKSFADVIEGLKRSRRSNGNEWLEAPIRDLETLCAEAPRWHRLPGELPPETKKVILYVTNDADPDGYHHFTMGYRHPDLGGRWLVDGDDNFAVDGWRLVAWHPLPEPPAKEAKS